jgi:hypothetical protein
VNKTQHDLLRDLWLTYDMQITAMKRAQAEGKLITASLHYKMGEQLLDTYFEMIDKLVMD